MSAVISSDATFSMEMFPFGHCPEGNGDVSSISDADAKKDILKVRVNCDIHHEEDEIPPTELEVDMNDFRFQVDAHIDHVTNLACNMKEDLDLDVIDFDDFDSEFASRKQVTYKIRVLVIESRRAIKVLKYDKERVRAKCYGIVIGYGTGKHGHDELNSTLTKLANITCSSNLKAKFRTYKTFKDKKGIKVKRGKPICLWTLHVSKCGRLCLEVDFAMELKERNRDTTVKIQVETNVDLTLNSRVWKEILSKAHILATINVDNNNGMYPIAYAIIEAECKSSWLWFLFNIGYYLDLQPNSNYIFISDRQKTKIELTLEQTQQGVSNEVLVGIEGVEE
ncbi:hypothetical protein Tco_1352964 [Tanacetum coccineum]